MKKVLVERRQLNDLLAKGAPSEELRLREPDREQEEVPVREWVPAVLAQAVTEPATES